MKSKIIGRKQLLIGILASSLCLAVFVNWYYTKPKEMMQEPPEVTSGVNLGEAQYVNGTPTDAEKDDYFGTAKLNRTKAHDNAKEHLQNIISDSSQDEETKNQAKEKLVNLSDEIKNESDIENLITAQISNNCLVTLSDESVEIILPVGTINDGNLIKIKDIVLSKTKLPSESITVIELK